MKTIRLACRFCDRSDFDGIDAVPPDWFSVDTVQSYEESLKSVDCWDANASVLDWYTHLGVCPECQVEELGFADGNRQAS